LGVPALDWTYGDDVGNIKSLIDVVLQAGKNRGTDAIKFDLKNGNFTDSDGKTLSRGEINALAKAGLGRTALAGGSTLARQAFLRSILREVGKAGRGTDGRPDGLLEKIRGFVSTYTTASRRIVYARGNRADQLNRAQDLTRLLGALTPQGPMTVARARNVINQLAKQWDIDVRVVATPADLPVAAPADARGFYSNGVIYVVASTNTTSASLLRTLGHEAIAHLGLRALLGREGHAKMMAHIQVAIKVGNKQLRDIRDKVRALYVDKDGKFNLSPAEESDEIAAFATEQAIDPVTGEFNPGYGWLKSVFAKVAEFLRSVGIHIPFSNLELQGLLVRSMRNLERGARQDAGQMAAAARGSIYKDEPATVSQIGDKWVVAKKLVNGGEAHEYYATKQQANDAVRESESRRRLHANRAAGSGARWWIEASTGFTGSAGFGRLSAVDRGNAVRATPEGRSESIKSRAQGLSRQQDKNRAGSLDTSRDRIFDAGQHSLSEAQPGVFSEALPPTRAQVRSARHTRRAG